MKKLKKTSTFRKMSMGTWKTVGDPTVYAQVDIDMSKALKFMKNYSEKESVRITATHLIGRAAAKILKIRPEINGLIRGRRIYLRKYVTLFFQVNIPGNGKDKDKENVGKADLSGCSVPHAEDMSLAALARFMEEKARKVKERKDLELKKSTNMTKFIPWWMIGYFLDFTSWLIYGLNIDLRWLGFPKDPFGSIMITNVGSLGIEMAWAPLVPFSRVPIILTVGAIKDKPVVVDGKVEIRPIMGIGCTFDHRFIDGVQGAHMAHLIQTYFNDPEVHLI